MNPDSIGALQDLLVSSFDNQMQNFHTAIPCVVVAVRENGNGAMVDIQPSINQKMKDGTVKERTTILGVPVSFPVSSTAGVLFPIKVGTTGTAIFSMRSIEAWKSSNGKPSTPVNFAKFDKSDAIFYPGITPPGQALTNPAKHVWQHSTDDVVVFNNIGLATENEVRLKQSGNIEISTQQDLNVKCRTMNVDAENTINLTAPNVNITATASFIIDAPNTELFGNLVHNGNYQSIGTFTFNGVVFSSHVHGTSPPPSNP